MPLELQRHAYPDPVEFLHPLLQETMMELPELRPLIQQLQPRLLIRVCHRILSHHYRRLIPELTTGRLLVDMVALNHENISSLAALFPIIMEDLLQQWHLLEGYEGFVVNRASTFKMVLSPGNPNDPPVVSMLELVRLKVIQEWDIPPWKNQTMLLSPMRVERWPGNLNEVEYLQRLLQEPAFGFGLPPERPWELFAVGPALLRSLFRHNIEPAGIGELWHLLATLHWSISPIRALRMLLKRPTGPLSQKALLSLLRAIILTLGEATDQLWETEHSLDVLMNQAVATGELSTRFRLKSGFPLDLRQQRMVKRFLPLLRIESLGFAFTVNTVTPGDASSEGGLLGLQFYFSFMQHCLSALHELRLIEGEPLFSPGTFYDPLSFAVPRVPDAPTGGLYEQG